MNRATIFRDIALARGKSIRHEEVPLVDVLLDRLGVPRDEPPARKVNAKGIRLMHQFEGCKLDAYPDPGSRDGNPWTIGYGATGPGIHRGVRWTQDEADARFELDLQRFAKGVSDKIGNAPTSDDQFSALVSLAYNIGLAAFGRSTVLRKHKAGDYAGAANAFGLWINNDGRPMRGLINRRAAEANLYRGRVL